MKIRSDSFQNGQPIPPAFAMGARGGQDGWGGNRNPHLAWDDVPTGAQSFVLLC
ncbi:MAG: YbhB/YbcL family Raf kinase inhibitor-like protein, partial [Lysobacteraceae bacterium]